MALVFWSIAIKFDWKQKKCVYHREQAIRGPMKDLFVLQIFLIVKKQIMEILNRQVGKTELFLEAYGVFCPAATPENCL